MNALIKKLHTAIIVKNTPFNEWVKYLEQAACMPWQLGLFFYYTTTTK